MTKSELLQDLNDRISAASVSGFWTPEMKTAWLDSAGKTVCGFYRWPFLELALERQTVDSREYYDYPGGIVRFKPNSIYQIDIEGETYPEGQAGRRRVNWQQFQERKQEQNPDPCFTNHNGFFFLYPVPQDDKEMSLYGLKGWKSLADLGDDDEPITPEEMDESIVRIALAACLRKAKKYAEAKAELLEVLDPTIGLLAQIKNQVEAEGPSGEGGTAKSSRWG